MAELSKFMKIVLIVSIIAALIYGILYLFVPDFYAGLNDPPAYDPHFWRLWGSICISLGIIGILGFVRNDWSQFWEQRDQNQTINNAFNFAINFIPFNRGLPLVVSQTPLMHDNMGINMTWSFNSDPPL